MSLVLRRELAGQVRNGTKTQHLLRKEQHPRCGFVIGESYAVQPFDLEPGRPPKVSAASCRVRVVAVWETELRNLTDQDAQQEGFEDRSQLFAWWRDRFNEGPLAHVPLWCIRFEIDHNEPERWMGQSGHEHGSADETSDEARGYVHSQFRALEPDAPAVPESWLRDHVTDRRLNFERERSGYQQEADIEGQIRRLKRLRAAVRRGEDRQLEIAAVEAAMLSFEEAA